MQIKSAVKKNNLYVGLVGELDQSSVQTIKLSFNEIFEKNKYRNVVFDMSQLSFMDSTGIGLILSRYKKLRKENVPVYISSPNAQIDKIIRVSGLYTIMPLL